MHRGVAADQQNIFHRKENHRLLKHQILEYYLWIISWVLIYKEKFHRILLEVLVYAPRRSRGSTEYIS